MQASETMPNADGTARRRVLFCTDFSANADHAFSYALDAVRESPGGTLFLLHVIPEPDAQFWKTYIYELDGVDAKARTDIDRKIENAYRSRCPPGVRMECLVRIGRPHASILETAAERKADLIILGRQGHGTLGKVLFGNVCESVVRKARCPVLVVPHET